MVTSDNFPLSEPIRTEPETSQSVSTANRGVSRAINCTPILTVADYLECSISRNTRKAYRNDLREFRAWGGSIPASPKMIAEYLADQAKNLAVSTLKRRLAVLSVAHQQAGYPSPTAHPMVRATMRGIARRHGSAQWRVRPILKEDLFAMLDETGESLRDLRDRAFLLVGFAAALRRSEIASLDVGDLEFVEEGILLTIRRSKTDQTGEGRKVAIPYGRERWCPVTALKAWLEAAGLSRGAAFVGIRKSGEISRRLTGRTIAEIIKRRAEKAGLQRDKVSGHSLRAGFVTSAARAGVPSWKIRAQTGHRSEASLARYIREADLFAASAVGSVL